MAGIDGVDAIGWGPIATLALAAAMSLLSYGDSNRRNKRAAEDIAKLEGDTEKTIADLKHDFGAALTDVRTRSDALLSRLSDYQREVERDYPRKLELAAMENRLIAKFEELKIDFGRKSIAHEVRNAVTAVLERFAVTRIRSPSW